MDKRVWKLVLGILISIALLYLSFKNINLREVKLTLMQTSLSTVFLSGCCYGLSCVFRALMWRITTRPLGDAGFNKLFGGVVVGYLADNLLPLKAGQIVRAFYLARLSGFSALAVIATIVIERIIDVITLLLLLGFAVWMGIKGIAFDLAKLRHSEISNTPVVAGGFLAIMILVLFWRDKLSQLWVS